MNIQVPKSIIEKNVDYQNGIKKMLIYENIICKDEILFFDETPEKFQGIYIEEKELIIYFAQKMNNEGKPKSRNTFVSQNFERIFNFRNKIDINSKILITLNFSDFSPMPHTLLADSIVLNLKILLTHINVSIGNSVKKLLNAELKPFLNLDEYIFNLQESSKKNKNNVPTYIEKNIKNRVVTVFGKLDGANYGQTIQHCRNLKLLKEEYTLEFYQLLSDNTKVNSEQVKKEAISLIVDEIIKSNVIEKNEKVFARNQVIFKVNIIDKYRKLIDTNKCFCCNYPITENLIAAHIHRHSDIERELNAKLLNLSKEGTTFESDKIIERERLIQEACKMTTSGSNGFLLCRNHDIEFEKGIIFFNFKKKKFVLNYKNNLIIPQYINDIIQKYENFYNFEKMDYIFIENIKKHYIRIGVDIEEI